MPLNFLRHNWAEIDLDALRHNLAAVRARTGAMPICAVVKANAYGHGAVQCARTLAAEGVQWFAVSRLTEAVQLRRGGITGNILVLGYTDPAFVFQLLEYNIVQTCHDYEYACQLAQAASVCGKPLTVHLKVDTGMGRIGFALRTDFEDAVADMCRICTFRWLRVTGLFQHFAVADETSADSIAYTREQHDLFCRAYRALEAAGHGDLLLHCDNSAGAMLHPDWPAGLPRSRCMARPGIILYGFDPSDEVRFGVFRPVMKLKAVISQIKQMQPGQTASYGRKYTAKHPTQVATVCCGYADGYPRAMSSRGMVEVQGKAAPVLGRVCMDQLMIDVTGIPGIKAGDAVTLWGSTVGDSAEQIAAAAGTISYEILCGVTARVPRVYLENGQPVDFVDGLDG